MSDHKTKSFTLDRDAQSFHKEDDLRFGHNGDEEHEAAGHEHGEHHHAGDHPTKSFSLDKEAHSFHKEDDLRFGQNHDRDADENETSEQTRASGLPDGAGGVVVVEREVAIVETDDSSRRA